MAEGFFPRNFVWCSSKASIEAGKVSVLACAEIVLSVAAYWWFAWYFDSYAHLLVSIVVAPMVLLRSGKSVALGVRMFVEFWEEEREVPLRSTRGLALIGASGFLAFGGSWFVAGWVLPGHEGWALFLRSALVWYFALNLAVAIGVAIAEPGEGAGAGIGVGAGAVAGALAVAGAVAGAGAGAVGVALVGATAVPTAISLTARERRQQERC